MTQTPGAPGSVVALPSVIAQTGVPGDLNDPGVGITEVGTTDARTLNPILIGVCGHAVLFGTGWLASRIVGGHVPMDVERLTYFGLKKYRATPAPEAAAVGRV